MSKATDEWYTPEEVLDAVEEFFGGMIGFDPTCSPDAPAWARALYKVTKEIDSVASYPNGWVDSGDLFLNMPYSNPAPFVELAIEYATRKRYDSEGFEEDVRSVLLTNAATSTRWC